MYSTAIPIDQHSEDQNRKVGIIISTVVHLMLLLIFWIAPMITPQDNPPVFSGIIVSFGNPDQGDGDAQPDTQQEKSDIKKTEEIKAKPSKTVKTDIVPIKSTKAKVAKAVATPTKKTKSSELEEHIKVLETEKDHDTENQKEADKLLKEKQEAQRRAQAKAMEAQKELERVAEAARLKAEAQKKAEEEARKKAEFEAKKKQFGDVIGKGKGKTGKAGNQGDPDGDPNANILKGLTTGKGTAGDGLGDRGILFEPTIKDDTQKTGRVAVKLCVNKLGQVITAKYTQKGSTTTDAHLIANAERNVRKYRFTKSTIGEQCGTITIDFKLK